MVSSVLVVDDDPDFLALVTRILEGMGIEVVTTAKDAAAAIAAANAAKPDAVLIDVGLPDRDGIDLAYELAALPWAPRVVLTSTDSDAAHAIDVRGQHHRIPFVPKDEVANASLRRLLMTESPPASAEE
jgi:CheY-like chemotaxis protein